MGVMPIPCPHFKITIVKRSQGQSAVAGAAYQSGERLFSEYDQRTKFYNKKKELVHAEIMLPSYAPPGYADRATLWNAVEAVENQWNSQLARRIVLAFPVEVPKEQYLSMIKEFCQEQFVSKGMIADFAIHDKGDGNPHAHILLTLRAIDEHGKWLPKARKVYDLDENGERIRLASGNWKCHKENTVDWNDQKYAEVWRHGWETITNRYLEAAGRPERVDLRSFERQGIQQIPTVHLGPAAHQMEKRGVETFLGNLNRDIRAANSLMQSIRSAIRGLQRWIADLNEKKQILLDALEQAKEPMYAKDTSRKIKSALRTRKKSGKYISSGAPFGYQKDPADHNHLVIDPNTAPVVEYIYSMAEEGLGLHRIAKRLHDEKVLKPCYYKKEMFGRFIDDEKMYDWDSAYISQVLHSPVYAGHIIYEAKPTVSMKSKKRRYIPFEERAIVPNTHEAIIPQDRWENVQRILYSRSSSFMCDKTDYDNIFKGIVRCADCGRTMLVKVEHRRKRNSVLDQTFYCCSTYRKYGAKACDSHNLEARVLHEAVFADIQAHAKAAVSNREALVKKIANQMHLRVSSDRAQHKRDLKQCKARIAEIEDLYAKLYEDVSKGLIPEKRFQMLADRYDKEQAELTEKIEQYEREGRAEHDQLDKIQDFIDEVSKYAGITELNYKILHQLIDKILVSKAEKVDGEYVQKIQIFYRFIGPLDAIE